MGRALQTKKSGNLSVGEIVEIEEGGRVPSDLVILSCSNREEKVLIRTDQIDGETDLKPRKPVAITQQMFNEQEDLLKANLEFVVDTPNSTIHKFEGAVHTLSSQYKVITGAYPLKLENSIW